MKPPKRPTANTGNSTSSTGSQPLTSSHGPLTSAQRGVMDTIMQGALVELFESCGVAVAPQLRGRLDLSQLVIPEISAAIAFTVGQSPKATPSPGRLTLSIPEALFGIMKVETMRRPQQFDWARELTNQLAARIKHRLLPFGASMQPLLPSSITRESLECQRHRFSNMRLYFGRTLRGQILVTMDGNIDETRLCYSGPVDVANAGDVIVF